MAAGEDNVNKKLPKAIASMPIISMVLRSFTDARLATCDTLIAVIEVVIMVVEVSRGSMEVPTTYTDKIRKN